MDVTSIPFNRFMKIAESSKNDYLLELDFLPEYMNHLNTVHAAAQFSLAEATSGKFLLDNFSEYDKNIVPVVRRVEVKYSKPAETKLYSRASVKNIDEIRGELRDRSRIIINVDVEIFDENEVRTMHAVFEWFIQKISK